VDAGSVFKNMRKIVALGMPTETYDLANFEAAQVIVGLPSS